MEESERGRRREKEERKQGDGVGDGVDLFWFPPLSRFIPPRSLCMRQGLPHSK